MTCSLKGVIMPVVILSYNANKIDEQLLRCLCDELMEVVAEALNIQGNKDARLSRDDIEIRSRPVQDHDWNAKDLEIMIFAHQYPERLTNLEERKEKVVTAVRHIIRERYCNKEIIGWVWILLAPTAFGRV